MRREEEGLCISRRNAVAAVREERAKIRAPIRVIDYWSETGAFESGHSERARPARNIFPKTMRRALDGVSRCFYLFPPPFPTASRSYPAGVKSSSGKIEIASLRHALVFPPLPSARRPPPLYLCYAIYIFLKLSLSESIKYSVADKNACTVRGGGLRDRAVR